MTISDNQNNTTINTTDLIYHECQNIDGLKTLLENNSKSSTCHIFIEETCQPDLARYITNNKIDNATILKLNNLNKIIEHSAQDQIISVETGIELHTLDNILSKFNQFFPVNIPHPNYNLAEFINNGINGPLATAYGNAKDLILGLTVLLADGTKIQCGGKVVKNVTGYDLNKLFCGSHASLGIIVEAHLRLSARPLFSQSYIYEYDQFEKAFNSSQQIQLSALPVSSLEIYSGDLFNKLFSLNNSKENKYYLLIQLHEFLETDNKSIENLYKNIESLISKSNYVVNGEEEKIIWHEITKYSQEFLSRSEYWLNLACSNKFILQFFEATKLFSETFSFSYRPSKNYCGFAFSTHKQFQICLDILKETQSVLPEQSYSISHAQNNSNKNFNYFYQNFPNEDLSLNNLKAQIKKEYDPKNILNPLVSL